MRHHWQVRRAFLAFLIAAMACLHTAVARAEMTVFTASSLTDVMEKLAVTYQASDGGAVRIVTGASSTLARQIASGAPADLFVSANREWADFVAAQDGFENPQALFGNALVLIADSEVSASPDLHELPALLGEGRLAVGDPTHVPAGEYARAALEAAGIWQQMADKLVPAPDVRTAVSYVLRGAAHFGLVYATDAREGVHLITRVDPGLYPPVEYFAVQPTKPNPDVARFLAYMRSPDAKELIVGMGFEPLEAGKP